MTPSRDRLTGITIERFRGVADRLELNLDADAVLIEGANGTGKTTIADAVAWCLTGQLPELVRRQEGEPRKFDHVVSAYRVGERARVTLAFRLDGEEVTLVRTGTGKDPGDIVFSGREGAAAKRLRSTLETDASADASDWLHSVTLLRQDLVARFATAPADKRYTQMRSLLGLSSLDRFEDATRSARTRQARVASEAESAATDAQARAESRDTALQSAFAVSRDDPGRGAPRDHPRLRGRGAPRRRARAGPDLSTRTRRERGLMTATLAGADWEGKLYSGGWRAADGGTIDVIEKGTGELLAIVGLA